MRAPYNPLSRDSLPLQEGGEGGQRVADPRDAKATHRYVRPAGAAM